MDARRKESPRRKPGFRKDKGEIRRKHKERLPKVEMWLLQGLSNREIANKLGLTERTVENDCKLIKQKWVEEIAVDYWKGRLIGQYELQLKELWAAWNDSKDGRYTVTTMPDGSVVQKSEPPDPRWMSGVLSVAKEVSTLIGIRNAEVQANISVDASTKASLAPMSSDEWQKLVEGGLPQVNQLPSGPGAIHKSDPQVGLPEKVNLGPASLNMVLDCARTPIITPQLSEPSEA